MKNNNSRNSCEFPESEWQNFKVERQHRATAFTDGKMLKGVMFDL